MLSWFLSWFSADTLSSALNKKRDVISVTVFTSEDLREMHKSVQFDAMTPLAESQAAHVH